MWQEIISLIGSVGFPIVACGYMAKFINTSLTKLNESVDANTLMLQKLTDKIEDKTE